MIDRSNAVIRVLSVISVSRTRSDISVSIDMAGVTAISSVLPLFYYSD